MIQHLHQSPATPARVVILGGSGFLGRHLAAQLRESSVKVLSLSSADVDLCASESVEKLADLLRPDDAVVFAAALTPDRGKDIMTTMRNLEMAKHVADALKHRGCGHLIYISSDAVYADDVTLASETSKCEPSSLYGMMHLMRERMMQFATAALDVPLCVIRPSILYGAGDTHNSYGPNRFARSAAQKQVIELFGEGEEKRDHVHVRDAARLIELSIAHRSTGVVNAATGRSVSFYDVAQLAAKCSAQPVKIVCHPRGAPITHRHYDVSSALAAFPDLRYTALREGLAESYGDSRQGQSRGAA